MLEWADGVDVGEGRERVESLAQAHCSLVCDARG